LRLMRARSRSSRWPVIPVACAHHPHAIDTAGSPCCGDAMRAHRGMHWRPCSWPGPRSRERRLPKTAKSG
jgi:hypothetical protein